LRFGTRGSAIYAELMARSSVQLLGLVLWGMLCVGGGALIGVATQGGDSQWYAALDKPAWTPPSWVFAPVWTTLYAAMAVAAWLVWREGGWSRQGTPLAVFLAQLTLNFAWSLVFFGLQQIGWALLDIVALWFLIVMSIRLFARVKRATVWLLTPYLAWVSFATALNAAIVLMN
jgi:tryptophan-rich sensory protein